MRDQPQKASIIGFGLHRSPRNPFAGKTGVGVDLLDRKFSLKSCAQFCAQDQTGLSCTGEEGSAEARVFTTCLQLRTSAA
jgi:hypothetical protein